MVVGTATLIKDSVILIRDRLAVQVTDPIQSRRSTNSKFILTANPTRPAEYPVITIQALDMSDIKAGASSEQAFVNMAFEIRIWARSEREKDALAQSTYDALRTWQHGSGEAIAQGLHNFNLNSVVNVDEGGKQGIKSKILTISYLFVATS